MIVLIILALLCVIAGIALFERIQMDAGYVLISLGETTVESSFWFAVFALLLLLIAIYAVVRLLWFLLRRFRAGQFWLKQRQSSAIDSTYREGLLCFLTGDVQRAQALLGAVSKHQALPIVRGIAEAQALFALNRSDDALRLLNTLESQYPNDSQWIIKTKAQYWLQQNKIDEAYRCLSAHPTVKANDPLVNMIAVKYLHQQNKPYELQQQIEKRLNKQWQPELLTLYSNIDDQQSAKRLKQAERWLAKHGDSTELLICLAKLCVQCQLWGQARSYLERSQVLQPSGAALFVMAQISETLDGAEASFDLYKQSAAFASQE